MKTTELEVVDFSHMTFDGIPPQDNPAFGDTECVMLTQDTVGKRTTVLHIIPHPVESVNHVAIFWSKRLALHFANWFAKHAVEEASSGRSNR